MDIRICALLLLVAVVGTHGDFNGYPRLRRIIEGSAGREVVHRGPFRIAKRAADVKGDTRNKDDPKDASGTSTESSSTTPKPTKSDPDGGTTTSTETSKTTSKPADATTKPTSEKPQLDARSAFEDKDPSSKPTNAAKKSVPSSNNGEPSPTSRAKADLSTGKSPSPLTGSYPAGSNVGSGYQPFGNYPFPGYNSIPSYGPNYAFTSTDHGPGGSASASAGSFASSSGFPNEPSFPTFNSRGGFFDNTPYYNPNGYNPGNVWSASPKKPTNDLNQDKPVTSSRSNFDADDKPDGNDAGPGRNPNSLPSNGPQNIPGRGFGGPYTPNFDYPAVNSVQGPNYAWTNSGPGYSGAAAGAFTGSSGTPTFSSRGGFADNNAAAPGFPDNSAYVPGVVGNGFAFPQPGFGIPFDDNFAFHQRLMEDHFRTIQAQIEAQQRAMQAGLANTGSGSSDPGVHSAISSISLGPRGGFQAGEISPVGPGIESRFAEELPAPSGGQVGVFASSSSSSMTGPDGKTISHKSSTTGVNDNGKIRFRTVQD